MIGRPTAIRPCRLVPAAVLLSAVLGVGALRADQGSPAPAQGVPRLVSSVEAAAHAERFAELLALVEGPNSPQARRTGARELFRLNHPDTQARVAALLGAPNQKPAKLALLGALADLPDAFAAPYIEPVAGLLAESDSELREAAISALAGCRAVEVVSHLSTIAGDTQRPEPMRLAAIETLGRMTHYDAVVALGRLLESDEPTIAKAATIAFEQFTAAEFQQDVVAARNWWAENRDVPRDAWQRLQIDRLAYQNRQKAQRFSELEQRLTSVLRDQYFRAPEPERNALLLAYLADPLAVVRLVGLDIVRALLGDGRSPTPEVVGRVRDMLAANEPAVRVSAIRTIVAVKDPADADRLHQLLLTERNREARQWIINGLGFLGSAEVARDLLALAADPDAPIATEAVRALGRLAERGQLVDAAERTRVADMLTERFAAIPQADTARREPLLRAMGRMRDQRFAQVFAACLRPPQPSGIREAAAIGLAGLADPNVPAGSQPTTDVSSAWLTATLAPATADESPSVRRAAVGAVSRLATSDEDLEVLCARLSARAEPDDAIRQEAWNGVLRVLRGRPVQDIERWLGVLPPDALSTGNLAAAVELHRVLVSGLEGQPGALLRLAKARLRLADLFVRTGVVADARASFVRVLEELADVEDPEAVRIALAAFATALEHGLYDRAFAERLSALGISPAELWAVARDQSTALLDASNGERAAQALECLSAWPPSRAFNTYEPELDTLLHRARQMRDRGRIRSAIIALRARPDDAAAAQRLVGHGVAAARPLADVLREIVSAETPDAAAERAVCEVLQAIVPEWQGLGGSKTRPEKIKALDDLQGHLLSDGKNAP